MRRVITVSLNGNAFQVEDDAYAALSAYLEAAERALANNPDRAEIIADLEQAIADKSARFLSAHRTVLAAAELRQILAEMGPVDGAADTVSSQGPSAAGGDADPGAGSAEPPHRRLYQISDGAKISGVCMGLAAYFGIDVTIVRLLFVLAALVTGGTALIVYIVLMFVVPYAQTSEQHAAAHGLPFNARVLVERAKQQASDFANHQDWRRSRDAWKREWRASRAAWKASWRRARAERSAAPPPPPPPPPPGPSRPPFAAHVLTGIVLAILGVILAVFTVAWVIAIVSLATTGAILGVMLPVGMPFWVGILLLVLVYNLVAWPIKALRHAAYHPAAGYHAPWVAPWDGVAALALVGVLAWYGYHHVAPLHEFIDRLLQSAQHTISA
jgi:phage shock protein PspC (stress-responsive transcriptional regulator)